MIDQYILYINNLKTNNIQFGKSSKHEEDAINFVYEKAIDIIKSDSGERHMEFAIQSENNFDNIHHDNKYPSGLYIKKNKHSIEIYEKKIKEPTSIHNILKSVVWDYKFINKPAIKYVIENNTFPQSNLYGFVISKTDTKYKILVKDTFKGTLFNYDDIKVLYEFNCDGFYMSKPNNINNHNNGDTIYYLNHGEESFIVELVKGIISVKQIEQNVEFNLVTIIGYNKVTIDLPYTSNTKKQSTIKNNNNMPIKPNHGAVFGQLSDVFKKYDIDSCTEQFRPSMLRKKEQ